MKVAKASPILLATLDARVTLGTPQVVESAWPVLFYLMEDNSIRGMLFNEFAIQPQFPTDIDITIFSAGDPDFGEFTALLSNGRNDDKLKGAWNNNAGLLGGGGGQDLFDLELHVPSFGPDRVGYRIESIREVVTVDLRSPGVDPGGDGIWTDWEISAGRYEFYGVPVPEPTSSLLCCASALLVIRARSK